MSAVPDSAGPRQDRMLVEVPLAGAATAGRYAVLELALAPGTVVGPCLHEREDQVLVVLAGGIDAELEGERRTVGVGGCLRVPVGAVHRYTAVEAARVLCICMPGGLDEHVRALEPDGIDEDDRAALRAAAGIRDLGLR